MSSPQSWEITPNPDEGTYVPPQEDLYGTWDPINRVLHGEEFELTDEEPHEEYVAEPIEGINVMIPYYPSGPIRHRQTARMSTPRLKRALSVSRSPSPHKKTKEYERGESSRAPGTVVEMMRETQMNEIGSPTDPIKELREVVLSLKEQVRTMGEESQGRIQEVHNSMVMARLEMEAFINTTNQRREQVEAATGVLAHQVMMVDTRTMMTEVRTGTSAQQVEETRARVDYLTHLFETRFGFP